MATDEEKKVTEAGSSIGTCGRRRNHSKSGRLSHWLLSVPISRGCLGPAVSS